MITNRLISEWMPLINMTPNKAPDTVVDAAVNPVDTKTVGTPPTKSPNEVAFDEMFNKVEEVVSRTTRYGFAAYLSFILTALAAILFLGWCALRIAKVL